MAHSWTQRLSFGFNRLPKTRTGGGRPNQNDLPNQLHDCHARVARTPANIHCRHPLRGKILQSGQSGSITATSCCCRTKHLEGCVRCSTERRRQATCLALRGRPLLPHSSSAPVREDPLRFTAASSVCGPSYAAIVFRSGRTIEATTQSLRAREAGRRWTLSGGRPSKRRTPQRPAGAASRSSRTIGNASRWSYMHSSGSRQTPTQPLRLSLQSYRRACRMQVGDAVSNPVSPGRVIVAGCAFATTERCAFLSISLLHRLVAFQSVQLAMFVDDPGFDDCGGEEQKEGTVIGESVLELDKVLEDDLQLAPRARQNVGGCVTKISGHVRGAGARGAHTVARALGAQPRHSLHARRRQDILSS